MTHRGAWRRDCAGASAVVLSGGKSRRMGEPKAFLDLGGRMLIERVLDVVTDLFAETLLVTLDGIPFERFGLPVIPDRHPGAGALGGLWTGISAAAHPRSLVLACDMPFLNPALLAHLMGRARGHNGAIPRGPDGLHPLHAVYEKRCAETLGRAIEAGALKLTDALAGLDLAEIEEEELRRFDPSLHSLFNVNRPEDLERARRILGGASATDNRPLGRD